MTAIQWTDETWNPVKGCSRVSEGCRHCYAEKIAARFSDPGKPFDGFASRNPSRWTGRVELVPEKLDEPLRWRKPRRVFVNSMSDLFHEDLTADALRQVWDVMRRCPQHTFQILTKRAAGMRETFDCVLSDDPLPNVWLGVSCEDQKTADERIPLLLQTPAAVRFVSLEPLLGPIGLARHFPHVHGMRNDRFWVIVGGESGPGARPCDVAWIRDIVRQCEASGVPAFVKQLGARASRPGELDSFFVHRDPKMGDPSEWPVDLRVREFPGAGA